MEDRDYAYLCLELCNGPNMEQVLEVRQKAWGAAFLVLDCNPGLFAEVLLCVLVYCNWQVHPWQIVGTSRRFVLCGVA